jgi:FkbM family methyltransferase
MPLYERIASILIGTPLQRPAEGLRRLKGLRHRLKHPELREIFLEDDRMERLIKNTIIDGMNCIDVGCHLGSVLHKFTTQSPSGHHLAIEPLPYKADWLRQKFPNVDVHQVALGEEHGRATFFLNTRRSGLSGLHVHGSTDGIQTIEVECRRLDDISPNDRRVGFLKVDVEGGEYGVFRGARRIIADSRPIILFECANSALVNFGTSAGQIFSIFNDEFRYRIFSLKNWLSGDSPLSLSEFESSMVYPFKAFNFVGAPQESIDHRQKPDKRR